MSRPTKKTYFNESEFKELVDKIYEIEKPDFSRLLFLKRKYKRLSIENAYCEQLEDLIDHCNVQIEYLEKTKTHG